MLNRNDLAKQFSLIVQQEIVNHNKSLDNTNLSINSINEKIKDIEIKFHSFIAKIESNILNTEIKFQYSLEELNKKTLKIEDQINSNKNSEINQAIDIKIVKDLINKLSIKIEKIHDEMSIKTENIFTAQGIYKANSNRLMNEINEIFKRVKSDIESFKNDILNKPSESIKVKHELEKKMEIDRVDFSGLMREITVFKRKMLIIEKNIENLYTKIEREKVGNK